MSAHPRCDCRAVDTRPRLAPLQKRGGRGEIGGMPKLATDSQQLLLLQQAQQLTHTDGHEFCIGADGHEVIGDPLATAGRHLGPGQIDDTQVAHVAQLVHAQVVQCIHRCIQLPQICTNIKGYI